MSSLNQRSDGNSRSNTQLPSPSATPEPEHVALLNHAYGDGHLDNEEPVASGTENEGRIATRRPSTSNEDAGLSDGSVKATFTRQIRRPGDGRRRSSVSEHERALKLCPKQIHELTSEPASIPIRAASPIPEHALEETAGEDVKPCNKGVVGTLGPPFEPRTTRQVDGRRRTTTEPRSSNNSDGREPVAAKVNAGGPRQARPALTSRAISTPPVIRGKQSNQRDQGYMPEDDGDSTRSRASASHLNQEIRDASSASTRKPAQREISRDKNAAQVPATIPLPPFSIPTFLALELAADRPSPLYIYRPSSTDFPYESSKIKYDRLVNFLMLPQKLECVLGFGAFACLDAWMHILTILPLRFFIAVWILVRWWGSVVLREIRDLSSFVYNGLGRVWRRRRAATDNYLQTPVASTPAEELPPPRSRRPSASIANGTSIVNSSRDHGKTVPTLSAAEAREKRTRTRYRHRRTKSTPSALLPSHKADILKGLLVITSCAVLMRFDASKMYHGIRGQAAIKLYVIYNVLEVCDRLLSAVGQDVLECLFSRETLDRNPDGRSKVLRPFWMFLLALVYNVGHATALFYQVITLNVAVNSYSNALLTLLLSNQFVEIKGTVFKKFEKENLFQLTCADVVERFQLWLMLLIIAMRNIVEVGGFSIRSGDISSWRSAFGRSNSTAPLTASSIIPMSFKVFPRWIGPVLNPFLLVLGSEMLVDWLKHAYITKFNQTKPNIYDKYLDVLAKDYYSDAFTDPNLTRRLGLPVIPLACLFIRAAVQTYHMFVAAHMPPPLPSTVTSLSESASTTSPATTAALARIDNILRRALGRSSFGAGVGEQSSWTAWLTWDIDDFIAFSTKALVFLGIYLFLLGMKIALGMVLLSIARNRYHGMEERKRLDTETGGKKIGGWGVVDVDEEKRRWIYHDDPESLKRLREKDESQKKKEEKERTEGTSYGHVSRYNMVAKRIW
ncbi:DUF747-domain-containing protein [Westerdykella ornata]|uniref:DUF747-domain-containing protein n=1 Tax=Westerdykella ornata TaxID=318751 RepID=A0A6A6JLV4_WESOR|nr:DUF747-domain-containing protein [Westerdykella ornata]KAF2276636.1 DUF747-domain-containing protein [Westerdykella ornata]